jgi:DNA-binding MarR family transcriptional regulator
MTGAKGGSPEASSRSELESMLSADLRTLTAESDRISRLFAALHQVSNNDFDALLHVMVAEQTDSPLTLRELRDRIGMTAAAVTYLVDRMVEAGHIRREPHPADRRKVFLRYSDGGLEVARTFFAPLGMRTHQALEAFTDEDLAVARRVLGALTEAMRVHRIGLATQESQAPDHRL